MRLQRVVQMAVWGPYTSMGTRCTGSLESYAYASI